MFLNQRATAESGKLLRQSGEGQVLYRDERQLRTQQDNVARERLAHQFQHVGVRAPAQTCVRQDGVGGDTQKETMYPTFYFILSCCSTSHLHTEKIVGRIFKTIKVIISQTSVAIYS